MISSRRTFNGVLTGVAITALALTGCSSSGSPAATSSSAAGGGRVSGGGQASGGGPTLAVYTGASGSFVKNFNPLSPTVLSEFQGLIYEPLFFFNGLAPLGTKPVPVLGVSYAWNATGTILTVTTKPGVTWSDGKPFSASDVAFTMNLIRNTKALNTSGNTPTAKATDATHVTLAFDKPSYTSAATILGQTYIVPEHVWKSKANPATDVNENPVGTGPMALSDFNSQSYLLKANAKFREASSVRVGGLRMYSLSGNEAATNKLLAGQLDWAGIFIPNVTKVIGSKPNLAYTVFGNQQVVLNTCSSAALGCTGPQTDPVVRQAIAAAINRDQVNKLAYYGLAVPISATFLVPGRDDQFIAATDKGTEPLSADVPKADSLLTGAGWTKGADGIFAKAGRRLSMNVLVTSGYTDYISALQTMAEQLKAAGIEINVQQVANQENNSAAALGKFQLQINGIFQGPTADPYYIYDKYFGSENTGPVGTSINPFGNVVRFSNKAVDAAIANAGATQDLSVKAKAYAIIQDAIVKDLPYIPVVDNRNFVEFNSARVAGFPTKDNLYAIPNPGNAPDNEQVLLHMTTK